MEATLPPEQEAAYSAIIDSILQSSDLETVSAKRIRKGLQERVDYDISHQKDAINNLIHARFDQFAQRGQDVSSAAVPEPAPTANGHAGHADNDSPSASPPKRKASDSEDMSDVADSPPRKPAKKVKTAHDSVETDEQLAKRMQAELNAQAARSTRGGGTTRKKAVAKKGATPKKKKSKAKVGSDEDSDVDSDKPEKERKGGFHKPMTLSTPLSELVGAAQLSRPQTVKKIWEYVKERDLQDPSDKRQIRCDDAMRAVFKQDRVHMFTMNKLLAQHLYAQDE
ncbi:hypothetical protein BDY17DRAFT_180918 [Neohortaea acidophila]|uniref:Uncharacterized protein n=1 Tax=Neohortaea acidophila TaxID=245834 RepID=A0A6A6PLN8_9PEZI|nr:uncharacterized protein BDY17DRAFT_180918 [Neohortaea acidophila]KAF2481008.1 hypothetical protein BDY17DRAFT_180918 [Neohortaea acidophila]